MAGCQTADSWIKFGRSHLQAWLRDVLCEALGQNLLPQLDGNLGSDVLCREELRAGVWGFACLNPHHALVLAPAGFHLGPSVAYSSEPACPCLQCRSRSRDLSPVDELKVSRARVG